MNTVFTQGNCLSGTLILNENVDADKYEYSGYGIGFDLYTQFLWTDDSWGKNVIIFGIDISLSVHLDNEKKNIWIIGEEPTQVLDNTTITTEDKNAINFRE